jgi:hypothetical protein
MGRSDRGANLAAIVGVVRACWLRDGFVDAGELPCRSGAT